MTINPGGFAGEARRAAAAATTQADRAEDAADELREIVESIDVGLSTDLFVFKDDDDNIVGRVGPDANWDILLAALSRADGLEVTSVETVGESSPLVIIDPESNVLYEAPAAAADEDDATAEVIAARGTRTALNDRLSQSLDAYGSPLDSFNGKRLRRLHYKRRRRALGEAVQLPIGLFGDSFTHNRARYSGDLAATLIAEMGDAGGGWTGFGFISGSPAGPYTHGGTQPSFTNGNVRSTYGVSHNGNWTGAYATVPSPDTCCAISSTAGDEIRATFPASPTLSGVDFFWIGTADGVMEYSWDGVSWATINVQGTVGACSFAALAGVPGSGAGTLRLRVVLGECRPAGVNWKSTASGTVVNKLAATGSRMAQLATQAVVASWRAAVAALGIDTAIVMHGTNDQGASSSAATFAENANIVLTNLQTAIPGVDRLLVMPPENQRPANAVAMPAYKAAAAPVAAALGCAFLDTQRDFGDPATPTEYGSAGATPLFNADLIHPEPSTGGRALLDAILRFFAAA
ncbi:GDSL-type esterase/lipase family protein [Novosphingobium sp.]|uniref:GDSL-type esterase/lipase family protein n=1 Tax=Novosphingobium sp. TaxID=1874826 RepID=UPI0027370CDC|nr:GDSL-type esterase/lipase family protein [Novosphingobium sp.]